MRGHGDVVVFEFTVDSKVALPACRNVLREIARCEARPPSSLDRENGNG